MHRDATREGWLIIRVGFWISRFHRNEKACFPDPRVFVEHGREMLSGEPACPVQAAGIPAPR
ncbi:DUF1651 domain-containing protein [Synechococcus sp. PROS-U-1]|uniref:DUF1651 domain-containing protein n=1 Tax=Synechococcus sp. PROS-U-1 TaxID=1400866 RepID=UPI0016460A1D